MERVRKYKLNEEVFIKSCADKLTVSGVNTKNCKNYYRLYNGMAASKMEFDKVLIYEYEENIFKK